MDVVSKAIDDELGRTQRVSEAVGELVRVIAGEVGFHRGPGSTAAVIRRREEKQLRGGRYIRSLPVR